MGEREGKGEGEEGDVKEVGGRGEVRRWDIVGGED